MLKEEHTYKPQGVQHTAGRDLLYADVPDNSDELLRYELIVDRTQW